MATVPAIVSLVFTIVLRPPLLALVTVICGLALVVAGTVVTLTSSATEWVMIYYMLRMFDIN